MLSKRLTIDGVIDLIVPNSFPDTLYKTIYQRTIGKCKDTFTREQFSQSWTGIAHRFRTNWEHSEAYTEIIQRYRQNPFDYELFYLQQRELYHFSTSSLSVIEYLCYSLYIMGFMLDEDIFKHFPAHLRKICPESTIATYKKYCEGNIVEHELRTVIGSDEYKELDRLRNIPIHRIAPKTTAVAMTGSSPDGKGESYSGVWLIYNDESIQDEKHIVIDNETTNSRYIWLVKTLEILLEATDNYTLTKF